MSPPKGTVLLTGATGFIGAPLLGRLLAEGYPVRAVVRRPATLPAGAEPVVVPDMGALTAADWRAHLAGVSAIVHTAGLAHADSPLPESAYIRLNTEATLALGRAAAEAGARLIFLSSIRAQAGASHTSVLTEAMEPAPTDAYGRSKLAAERGLAALPLWQASLRPVLVVGGPAKGNLARLLRLADGPWPLPFAGFGQPRTLLAREDLIAAILLLLRAEQAPAHPLIVADPDALTFGDMLALLRQGLGRPARLLPGAGLLLPSARLLGRYAMVEKIAGGLVAQPAGLLAMGWRPTLGARAALVDLGREWRAQAAGVSLPPE